MELPYDLLSFQAPLDHVLFVPQIPSSKFIESRQSRHLFFSKHKQPSHSC